MTRRTYLDWLRGIAVLIMIETHTLDSWTRLDDRSAPAFGSAMVLGGFGAPVFLFLAGIALALAAQGRLRKGSTDREAAALARRRGWQIFALAFVFRLQSWLISGGPFSSLLKADILNVMGLSMLGAAVLWGWGRSRWSRAVWLVGATIVVAMVTPLIREADSLAVLPDRLEAYFRPVANRGSFMLFPWTGFLFAGGALGMWLDSARTPDEERRTVAWMALCGPLLALAGYAASFLPMIYERSSFWTSSPTFFFLRVGVLVSVIPVAYAWAEAWGWLARRSGRSALVSISPVRDLGLASLFVYWIHVEMVYGTPSEAIHKQLPFGQSVLAFAAFTLFLYALVKLVDATKIKATRLRATKFTTITKDIFRIPRPL